MISQKTTRNRWKQRPSGFLLCFQLIRYYVSKTSTEYFKEKNFFLLLVLIKVECYVSQKLSLANQHFQIFQEDNKKKKKKISGSKTLKNIS